MIRLFKHYIPTQLLLLGIVDLVALFLSAELAWQLRRAQVNLDPAPFATRLGEVLVYGLVVSVTMLAVGLYQADGSRAWRMSATRLITALAIAFIALSVIFYLFPDVALWRSIAVYATGLSFVALLAVRAAFGRLVSSETLRRRIVVIGTGPRAQRMQMLSAGRDASFRVTSFVAMSAAPPLVEPVVDRDAIGGLDALIERDRADEVVLAVEERRGALPTGDLLQVKLGGTRVSEMSTFLERETGRVDLSSVSPSWLIFSDGFLGAQWASVLAKRIFDVGAAVAIMVLTSPILVVTAILVKVTSPGPIFYRQERVGQFGKPFLAWKFRSMRQDAEKGGQPQWAQQHDPRVTAIGRFIRATRIDEIPQIINVLRGDMSIVGPRPERPFFVRDLAAQIPFYNERHVVKPGIAGWAQLNYPYGASVEDARHKLEYDLYYVKNYSVFLDLLILVQTVRVVLWRSGVR